MGKTLQNILPAVLMLSIIGHCLPLRAASPTALQEEVIATERAFAKSMTDRDLSGFSKFVSREAVFFSDQGSDRGRVKITDVWSKYFKTQQPPFSWEPSQVEVLESGTLALSSGPVKDPSGKIIGTFTSIWRREAAHTWRIIFDKGNDMCNP